MIAMRAVVAFVVCFVIARGLGYVFYLTMGERMLSASGHVPDTLLPTSFVLISGLVHVLGGIVAAWALLRIVNVRPWTHAIVIGALITAIDVANSPTLLTSPYWYDWPHVLTPFAGLVLGMSIFIRRRNPR